MSNPPTFIKIVVANLMVVALVATYMFSNDSSVGLLFHRSRRYSPYGIQTQPGNFPNFPNFNSQTLSPQPGNFINDALFNSPGSNLSTFVTNLISGANLTTSAILSFEGFNPDVNAIISGFNASPSGLFNNQGFNFRPVPNGVNSPTTSGSTVSIPNVLAIVSSIFNATINSFNQIQGGGRL
jgi:hypothetical protein